MVSSAIAKLSMTKIRKINPLTPTVAIMVLYSYKASLAG